MTGPEHYLEAEKLLLVAGGTGDRQLAQDCQQAAQVHAILALAATTAMAACDQTGMHWVDFSAWDEAAGVPISNDAREQSAKCEPL